MQLTVLVLILQCFRDGHALVPSGQEQPAINHPGYFSPVCQQVTVPKVSTMIKNSPPSQRRHRGTVLVGSSCVLGCLHLTVVHQQGHPCGPHPDSCLVSATWPHLGRRSLLHWEPALVMTPSEAFILPHVQTQRCQDSSTSMILLVFHCQNESWTGEKR